MSWRQFGNVLMAAGLAFLAGIPGAFWAHDAIVSAHSHRAWWWPTWWMLGPLVAFVVGVLLVVIERERSDPPATAPEVPVLAHRRTGIRMKGGSLNLKGFRARNQDEAIDAEETEITGESWDIE